MWIWIWLACETPCGERAPGVERDACTHAEVLAMGPDRADQALARLRTIDDPIVRGAAVMAWVGQHARRLDPATGRALCQTLDGPDQGRCLRRLQSAHLQR